MNRLAALRLLLVEDSARDARVLRELLVDADVSPPVQLTHVTTLQGAVAALAAGRYDCVLLDLRLPDGEGVEGVDRIREQDRETAIVVLTGNNDQQAAINALRRGAQEYAVKGQHDGNEILRLIRHAITRNRLVVEVDQQRQLDYRNASHDALTGLPNRQLFQDRMRIALSHARRDDQHLVVCFLDLDGFKAVNDAHGHATGDALLAQVAAVLGDSVRAGDTVARLGGDEFAILLTQARDADEATAVAARMVARVAAITQLNGLPVTIGASVGLALHPQHGINGEQLLANADRAMYRAKSAGKSRWHLFGTTEGPPTTPSEGLQLADLRLRFLPWYDLRSRACMGIEALVRLDEQAVQADPVLQCAREHQTLPLLGSWVLQKASQAWLELARQQRAPPRLAINVAEAELEARDYATSTLRLLAEQAMPASALQLEVAEDVLAAAAEGSALLQNLTTLRGQGVHIALDQFGRNQAALGRLASWPVNVIKLDARCVRDLRSQPSQRALLASISGYAEALQHEVIYCGIESATDLDNLRPLSPTLVQGFGLAPPLASQDLCQHLPAC